MKKAYALIPLFLFSLLISSFYSCDQDTNFIVEEIIIRDTIEINTIDTLIIKEYISDTTTTFILVRHAETTGIGSDPSLSSIGIERANDLANMLSLSKLSAIYSTDFNRTKETAQVPADFYGLTVNIYPTSNLPAFANLLLVNHVHEVVLIVGHSNTTPSLANAFLGTNTYANFNENDYSNFLIISVYDNGNSKVLHLKY